uniref:Uncharacterized protein n=1 Tax=uncultured Rhodospirillales bacterium HF4000_24M03 TaxID=710788 RepID=E0XW46_9PROT|nr:hypothetical protein [uncultured Rhodospirillales bacterium HF4000_24M03]
MAHRDRGNSGEVVKQHESRHSCANAACWGYNGSRSGTQAPPGIGLVPQRCRIPISFTLPPFQTREGFSRLASNVCVVDCRSH